MLHAVQAAAAEHAQQLRPGVRPDAVRGHPARKGGDRGPRVHLWTDWAGCGGSAAQESSGKTKWTEGITEVCEVCAGSADILRPQVLQSEQVRWVWVADALRWVGLCETQWKPGKEMCGSDHCNGAVERAESQI